MNARTQLHYIVYIYKLHFLTTSPGNFRVDRQEWIFSADVGVVVTAFQGIVLPIIHKDKISAEEHVGTLMVRDFAVLP